MTEKEYRTYLIKIGLNIAYYRKLCGLSQETLAQKTFCSRQWLGQIEIPGI